MHVCVRDRVTGRWERLREIDRVGGIIVLVVSYTRIDVFLTLKRIELVVINSFLPFCNSKLPN